MSVKMYTCDQCGVDVDPDQVVVEDIDDQYGDYACTHHYCSEECKIASNTEDSYIVKRCSN
jgi:ribosomal protein S24E